MQLSTPLNFLDTDLRKNITLAINTFRPVFLNKGNRPNFRGKFIFFDMNRIEKDITLPYPEKIMHIISLEPKSEHVMFPCNNDITFSFCDTKCELSCATTEFKLLNRSECYYRMARIHWIPEIISLANQNSTCVQVWTERKKDEKGKMIEKTFIRYQEGIVDYVIILRHIIKQGDFTHYYFDSAFPVFLKRNKIQYTKKYQSYLKSLQGSLA